MPESQVVAVTRNGPYEFPSLTEALAHPGVSLADPIFKQSGPIDRTLIRGIGLEGYNGEEPWDFLLARAIPAPIPVAPAKRKKGKSCGE